MSLTLTIIVKDVDSGHFAQLEDLPITKADSSETWDVLATDIGNALDTTVTQSLLKRSMSSLLSNLATALAEIKTKKSKVLGKSK